MKKLTLEELLRKSKEVTYADIKREIGMTRKTAKSKIQELREKGVPIKAYLDEEYITHFYLQKSPESNLESYATNLHDGNYVLGFTGDWHTGSKYFDEDSLGKYFDECDDRGVLYMLHTGDIIDGVDVFRGQQVELSIHTKMEQAEYVRDVLPSLTSGETLFITGNHDLKHLENSFDPGVIIDAKPHYTYLGQIARDVEIGGLDFRLIHLKGQAYARGYGIQKYLRGLTPNEMPDLLLRGHNHQAMFMLAQGVYCFETGTFQKGISNFVKEHGMAGKVSAWIVEVNIENGKLAKLKQELLVYD